MKKLIVLYIVLLFGVSAQASHLQHIAIEKLPLQDRIKTDMEKLLKDEKNFENYGVQMPENILNADKKLLIEIIDEYSKYLNSDENGELHLFLGLIASYAYNLDMTEYKDKIVGFYNKAASLMPTDYRPQWFLGKHYYESAQPVPGVKQFKSVINNCSVDIPLFWDDYASAAYLAIMPMNMLMALDKVKMLSGTESIKDVIVGKKIRESIKTPDKTADIPPEKVWNAIVLESEIVIRNYACGIVFTVPFYWQPQLFPFIGKQKISYAVFEFPPAIDKMITANVVIKSYIPGNKEKLSDFIEKNKLKGYSYESYKTDLNFNETAIFGKNDNSYTWGGGARIIQIAIERKQPEISGIALEEPLFIVPKSQNALPKTDEKVPVTIVFPALEFYKRFEFKRFEGRIFYIIALDYCEAIAPQSIEIFNNFLKSIVID